MNELRVAVLVYKLDIICITETMLNENIFDAEISLSGYTLFRSDRKIGNGGGSCIFV